MYQIVRALSALQALPHLILTTILKGKHHPHITDERTEAEREVK